MFGHLGRLRRCACFREQVQVGDVIYIEANSGSVKRVGRCDTYSSEYDLEVRISKKHDGMLC